MLRKLANHNDDIRRLLEKGYALKLDSSYLVVRDVPYLDHEKRLKKGAIVTKADIRRPGADRTARRPSGLLCGRPLAGDGWDADPGT